MNNARNRLRATDLLLNNLTSISLLFQPRVRTGLFLCDTIRLMQKEIELLEQKIPYTLKTSSRAKRLRLAVYHDGAFVVTAPQTMSHNAIEKFIIQKSQWVIDKLQYFRRFTGEAVKRKSSKKDFTTHKERARALAHTRLVYFNETYRFNYNRISIKNQKSRWGSCSSKGNLNFNYKIALLPERLANYIIVHELCHLGEFNHSQKFWDLVAQTIPDYVELRKELKRSGASLQ